MASKASPIIFLMPLSLLLLSVLDCIQFMSKNGLTMKWGVPRFLESSAVATPVCEHKYTVEIMSIDPLMLYLNDFISDTEIQHLLKLGEDHFAPSQITHGVENQINLTARRSQTAFLTRNDPVCDCLTERMKSLLGNVQHEDVEGLQLVKYSTGGDTFRIHTDWTEALTNHTVNSTGAAKVRQSRRLGSIFVYLEDSCDRGETFFPHLSSVSASADGDKFAMASSSGKGLLVKPKRRNAIFWNNLHANGSGDFRLAHAGLPIESGVKIGLNMWSSYYVDLPMVGGKD